MFTFINNSNQDHFKVLIVALFAFISCSRPDPDNATIESIVFPYEEIPEIEFYADGGVNNITFEASGRWTAEAVMTKAEEWLKVYPENGEAGTSTITISVEKNTSYDARKGEVILNCNNQKYTLKVYQNNLEDILVDNSLYSIGNDENTFEIHLSSNVDYSVEIDERYSWLSVLPTKGLTDSLIEIHAETNDAGSDRTGEIQIRYGSITRTVSVLQSSQFDIISFADPEFKKYMCDNFDISEDNELQRYEAALITEIDCSGLGLTGISEISYCTGLKRLVCENNDIKEANVSYPSLKNLEEISFKDCEKLGRLWIHNKFRHEKKKITLPEDTKKCILVSDNYFEAGRAERQIRVHLRKNLASPELKFDQEEDAGWITINKESDTTYLINISECSQRRDAKIGIKGNEEDNYCTEYIYIYQDPEYEEFKSKTRISSKDGYWIVYEEDEENDHFEYTWEVEKTYDCECCSQLKFNLGEVHCPDNHQIDIKIGVLRNGEDVNWRVEYNQEEDREWVKVPETGKGIMELTAHLNGNPNTVGRTAFFRLYALNDKGEDVAYKQLLRISQDGVQMRMEAYDNVHKFHYMEGFGSEMPFLLHTPYPSSLNFKVHSNVQNFDIVKEVITGDGFTSEGAEPDVTYKYMKENIWEFTIGYDSNRNINEDIPYHNIWRGVKLKIRPVVEVEKWSSEAKRRTLVTDDKKIFQDSLMTIQLGVDIRTDSYGYIASPVNTDYKETPQYNIAKKYDADLNYIDDTMEYISNVSCRILTEGQYDGWGYSVSYGGKNQLESDGYGYDNSTGELRIKASLDTWEVAEKYHNRKIIRNKSQLNGQVGLLYAEVDMKDEKEPLIVPFAIIAQYGIPLFFISDWKGTYIDKNVLHYDFDLTYQMTVTILEPQDDFSHEFLEGKSFEYTYYTDPYEHPTSDAYESWTGFESDVITTSMMGYWGTNIVYNDIRMKLKEDGYIYAYDCFDSTVTLKWSDYNSVSSRSNMSMRSPEIIPGTEIKRYKEVFEKSEHNVMTRLKAL